MPGALSIVSRNEEFAESFDGSTIPNRPQLMTVIVTCVDARVDPAHFAGLELGDAMVIRALGGRITDPVGRQVATLSELVRVVTGEPLLEVVLVHHTSCGTGRFAEPEIAAQLAAGLGVDPSYISSLAVTDPAATVRADLAKLGGIQGIPASMVGSGYVYDVATGLLEEIVAPGPLPA
jgi:carbonic anhydrase